MHSNDFSLFALFTAGFGALVGAYTPPSSPNPDSSMVVTSPLTGAQHTAGEPMSIQWTTTGLQGVSISLILLDGCPKNCVPVPGFAPIPGTDTNQLDGSLGSFSFTPPAALGQVGQGYGIQMIRNDNGHFQWSGNFGIGSSLQSSAVSSSPSSSATGSSAVSSVPASSSQPATTSGVGYTTEVVTSYTTYCPSATTVVMNNQTYAVPSPTILTITDCPCTVTKPASPFSPSSQVSPALNSTSAATTPTPYYPTGASSGFHFSTGGLSNLTVVLPTLASSAAVGGVSASGTSMSKTTSPPISSSGAGQLGMSIGGLAVGLAAAVMAF